MKKPTHLSLFSGIGGLDLAAEMTGFETIGQCEWADFPTKVLEKHWPNVPRWRDIHDLSADSFRERTGIERPTIISGGFPCQPHSVAGKRKASLDERDLWPEYRRVVGELRPEWVVAENVRGLLSSEDGRYFRGILRDFAELGYDVGWCVISAAAVGAIHRRERMAIVANTHSIRRRGRIDKGRDDKGTMGKVIKKIGTDIWTKDTICIRQYVEYPETAPEDIRINYGFSDWTHRIKALGNAVVPQQFYPIFKGIYEIIQEERR